MKYECECVCVCVCLCARLFVRAYVCVCVFISYISLCIFAVRYMLWASIFYISHPYNCKYTVRSVNVLSYFAAFNLVITKFLIYMCTFFNVYKHTRHIYTYDHARSCVYFVALKRHDSSYVVFEKSQSYVTRISH